MRIACFGDIHANAVSLTAALEQIRDFDPDEIICLGDVAATGPQPVESLALIRQLGCPVVMGNTDEWILEHYRATDEPDSDSWIESIDWWCMNQLSTADIEFISTFGDTHKIRSPTGAGIFCYHGSPRSNTERIEAKTSENRIETLVGNVDAKILVGGHTHEPLLRRFEDKIIVNPGSIGQPFERVADGEVLNPPWAEWATITSTSRGTQIEFRRTPVESDRIISAAEKSDMPHSKSWKMGWVTADEFDRQPSNRSVSEGE